ncbi:MAG: hypothetical protein SWH68_05430 [Thermodesulfobacteriota bacterium]|nr:hypothetical protein [Thermodesulfobacteriota bacterium]
MQRNADIGLFTKPSKLDQWKPDFDSSGAEYKCIIPNVSHPAIKGVYAGFAIRDALWEATGGRIYIDYKPFSHYARGGTLAAQGARVFELMRVFEII